jgi:hypothetical protein
MRVPIQRVWHRASQWRFLSLLRDHEPLPEPPEAADEVAFRFKECEDCTPKPEQVEAKERERAEQFKRDQLLPIIGLAGPPY